MHTSIRNLHKQLWPRTQWAQRAKTLLLLPLASLLIFAPGAQAARPGGVAVLLPPFVMSPPPQLFLPTVSPFDIVGFIQSATVDTPTDYFSAGWMEVNGFKIRIPRNTIFQMPATQMSWADMFMNAPAAYKALGQSGLALSDTPKPLTTYEVHVQGNRVVNVSAGTDQYIAGLVYIAQQAGTAATGIVNAIDYSKCASTTAPCMPDVWVGTTLQANTGARMRINTISGRFGAPDANIAAGLVDKRFTADEDNPTVAARTGYPMCLPRFAPPAVDSLCPVWNRPTDAFTTASAVNYTMPAPGASVLLCPDNSVPGATGCANGAQPIMHQAGFPSFAATGGKPAVFPDAYEQVPVMVGDYITFVGNIVQDAPCAPGAPLSSCQYISAHTLTAEVGVYTAPGTWPVYSFMSEFRIGVGGTPNPMFPQEAVEKVFGDFFTTDNSQLVDVYACDIDSTTGVETHRYYGSSDPFGPPLGGLKGRARFRVTVGNFMPPTRFMAVASRSWTQGAPVDFVPTTLTANGLKAGYFEAPQFEFIFPENLVLGSPQIPLTFQEFPFLANGSGPYVPWNTTLAPVGVVGQLNPWPSINAPPALSNSTAVSLIQPPVANAGPAQTVSSNATVTLDASLSVDPGGLPMIYTWMQSAGPAVTLLNTNPSLARNTFVAPTLPAGSLPVVLTFQLGVCNGFTCGGVVSTNVTVTAAAGAPTIKLAPSPSVNVSRLQVVTLTATASGGTAPYTYTFTAPAGIVLANGPTPNVKTFTVPVGTPLPSTLVCSVTVKDSASKSATTSSNILVGPDVITVLNITYSLSKSRLQASVSDSVPGNVAVITMTPLDANGAPTAAAIATTYDPTLNAYLLPLNFLTNPVPNSVQINSSLGASLNAPVQRIR